MKCPKDGSPLVQVRVGGIVVDKCHQCDGIWLDYGELKQLRASGQQGLEEELEQRYGNPAVEQSDVDGYMRCPVCEDAGLMSHHVSYFKPVKIDRCPSCHGMWLDDGELDTLLEDKKEMDEKLSSPGVMEYLRRLARQLRQASGGR
jgi:Zn-finger nucleic acid-binding protein